MKFFYLMMILIFMAFQFEGKAQVKIYDQKKLEVSNMDFIIGNDGAIGFDREGNRGGLIYPAFSDAQYLFGGGFMLLAKKPLGDTMSLLMDISYDLNIGKSYMVPGRIEEGKDIQPFSSDRNKVYSSLNYNPQTGESTITADSINWPVWFYGEPEKGELGNYLVNNWEREPYEGKKPAIASDQDLVTVFKDTDLRYYNREISKLKQKGYPLGIQYEQWAYGFDDNDLEDIVYVYYNAINKSEDTLSDVRFIPVFDISITSIYSPFSGEENDHAIVKEIQGINKLNKIWVMWSDSSEAEEDLDLNYMGIALIMTPNISESGTVEYINNIKNVNNQAGTGNFGYIPFDFNYYKENEFLDLVMKDHPVDPSGKDQRIFLSSRPFMMYPSDTMQAALMIFFAPPAKGGKPDGTDEDLANIIAKAKTGVNYFYNNLFTAITGGSFADRENIKIFPQPANNNLNVDLAGLDLYPPYKVKILDLNGREMFTGTFVSKSFEIDTKTLGNGTYFIDINGSNKNISRKFLISR